MSNATTQVTSTRADARRFADAFSAADDAFASGPELGESRELTLAELGELIALKPVAAQAPHASGSRFPRSAASASEDRGGAPVGSLASTDARDDQLLTLHELGEALARPASEAEALDFDFGTSAHERARIRTAARLDASPRAHRRLPAPEEARTRPAQVEGRLAGGAGASTARPTRSFVPAQPVPGSMAEAAASVADHFAGPAGAQRFARDRSRAKRPAALRSASPPRAAGGSVAPPATRVFAVGRRDALANQPRLRELDRREGIPRLDVSRFGANPERIAMWAVLLGILLVLIAFTSGSAGALAVPLVAGL